MGLIIGFYLYVVFTVTIAYKDKLEHYKNGIVGIIIFSSLLNFKLILTTIGQIGQWLLKTMVGG